jgi:ubiquinone/menaquinone biosynthesis C-methylase UbiE/uncharacterized protein YbaR (Trm112 family)
MMYKELSKIAEVYNRGENVSEYLRNLKNKSHNDTETILISYDFQAGEYSRIANQNSGYWKEYTGCVAKVLDSLNPESLCEAGVGEATTLVGALTQMSHQPQKTFGFDLSWSRIKYARRFAEQKGALSQNLHLFTGNLFSIPMTDQAVDVLYTSHSIESNGGREKEALSEMMRVAKKWLVLLEPAYELADKKAKQRMEKHGYVRNLPEHLEHLGAEIIEYRLFEMCSNPLNPTGLIIAKMPESRPRNSQKALACPVTKTELQKGQDSYYSPESLLAYPIVEDVPCLLHQNAILATKYLDDRQEI